MHLSAARGYLRASPDFSVGGILNKLIFKTYHCFGHVFNNMLFFFFKFELFNKYLHYFSFLVCHHTSVPVQLFKTPAVICHSERGADWTDGLPEEAVVFSGGCAHAGY